MSRRLGLWVTVLALPLAALALLAANQVSTGAGSTILRTSGWCSPWPA
jgi:hypothetical protein